MRLPKAGERWAVSTERYRGREKGDVAVVLEVGYAVPKCLSEERPLVWWAWADVKTWGGCRGWPRRRFHDAEREETFREGFMRNFEPCDPEAEPREVCELRSYELRQNVEELKAKVASLNADAKGVSKMTVREFFASGRKGGFARQLLLTYDDPCEVNFAQLLAIADGENTVAINCVIKLSPYPQIMLHCSGATMNMRRSVLSQVFPMLAELDREVDPSDYSRLPREATGRDNA